jgi:hypothetical protein
MPIEDIAHLVGHANTRVTELVYRKELRPVLTRGAVAMDLLFPDDEGRTHIGKQIGKQSQADQPEGLDHDDKGGLTRGSMVELRGLEPLTSSMPWWPDRRTRRAASVHEGHPRAGAATFVQLRGPPVCPRASNGASCQGGGCA